ncbi:cell division protein [Thermococcus alcaliphilus]|uniref:cell division protein n=1 Tax=Thermococcus alcaliphilus TaxID=139207 RepID=UPI002091044E|nr:cell division protein [Thermococcus alcaliphilus]MCO6041170.1 cell division protein [Thermococcus alcaliphilus]
MKKLVGNVMLTAGLITGAIASARNPPLWFAVGGALFIMGAGIVLRRQGEKEELHRNITKGEGGEVELKKVLENALTEIETVMKEKETDLKKARKRLGKVLETLETFAEKAQPLRIKGIKFYGEIMTSFSKAERHLNRAWSAYADGYIREGDTYLESGYAQLRETSKLLKSKN